MPFDPAQVVSARLKAIWLADATFLASFRAGNLMWRDVTDPRPRISARGPGSADWPKFGADLVGGDLNRNAPKYFPGATVPDHGIPVRLQFVLTVVHEKPNLTMQTPIVMAVMNPILLALPRLSIAWVGGGEFSRWERRDRKDDSTGGILRTVETTTLTINGMPARSLFAA